MENADIESAYNESRLYMSQSNQSTIVPVYDWLCHLPAKEQTNSEFLPQGFQNCMKSKYGNVLGIIGSRGSSVSIVSDNRLDDRAMEVRSSAEAKGFFL
jgi:hypothetical protein